MSVETRRDGPGRCDNCRFQRLAAGAALSARATNRSNSWRRDMNISPELLPILADLQKRFRDRIEAVHSPRANEIYVHAKLDLVAGFAAHLCRNCEARLVNLFADDARETEGAFHLYYVFALDAAHGFIILRVPESPEKPEFASQTNAIHGVNWQEREVQDLFGLKLIGHPNPRRCALHDDWPEVHPLRKDFDLDRKSTRLN